MSTTTSINSGSATPQQHHVSAPTGGGMTAVTLTSLWAHRSRFLLTALAVVLSVTFFTSILLLTDALQGNAAEDIAAANDGIDVVVQGAELAGGSGPGLTAFDATVPLDALDTVRSVDGVVDAVGVSSGYARVLDAAGQPVDAGAFSSAGENWVTNDALNPYDLADGSAPVTPTDVVIEQSIADSADVGVGDAIRVATATGTIDATVSGIATYGSSDGAPTTSTIFFSPDSAATTLATSDYDRIVVQTDPAAADIVESIDDSLASDTTETISGAMLIGDLQDEVEARTGFQTTFLLFFAIVALIAGTTIIYNTFVIAVQQRTRELALLRSIGASRRQVLGSVMSESAVIGVVSSIVGAVLGIAGFYGLIALFEAIGLTFLSGSVSIAPMSLIVPALLGVVVTLASAFFPARRAASIPPIAALRDASVDSAAKSTARNVSGAALLVIGAGAIVLSVATGRSGQALIGAGALFAGTIVAGPMITRFASETVGRLIEATGGITGKLARTNAARNPKRSASTAFALTLGVMLIALFTTVASSIGGGSSSQVEDGLRADRVVSTLSSGPGAEGPTVPASLATDIAAVDGVEVVSPIATSIAVVDGDATTLGGIDVATLDASYDLDIVDGSLDNLDDNSVVVSTDSDLAVGDVVEITDLSGRESDFTVVALSDRALPGTPVGPTHLVTDAALDALVPGALDAYVFVTTNGEQATIDALAQVVDDAGGVSLYTADEYAESLTSFIDTFTNFVYALLGVAVIIAVVGIANTTVMSINERSSEIGMVRAIGGTRAQIRSMIRNEAFMLSIQGSLLGLALGVAGAHAVFALLAGDEGFGLAVPWVSLAWIGVLGAVAGVAAAAWPAWRAARLDPLSAIDGD